jgi:glycosyltransferase involved in cell wall biosynthesis
MGRGAGGELIAIVLPDLRGGGAERIHINLAHAWTRAGFQVEFVVLRARGELISLLPPGATIRELGVDRVRWAIRPLSRYFKQRRPTVTLAAMWPLTSVAVIAWSLAGRIGKLFLSDHTPLSIDCVEELGTNPTLLKFSIRLTYPAASGVIAVSNGVKIDLCTLAGLRPESVDVIYNPAAIDAPGPVAESDVRLRRWGGADGFHVLSVGTLKPVKDHTTLLEAFASLPPGLRARLTIVGDGPLRKELSELTQRLGLTSTVRFTGFEIDPSDWYRTADVFVLSSRWEGFGNVIVEALSFGLPVVSTDCPSGPSEILEGGRYGTLVPVGDPPALARAIEQSRDRPVDRALQVRRSRDFSVDVIASRYLSVMGVGSNGRR